MSEHNQELDARISAALTGLNVEDHERIAPPASVWESIAEEAGVDQSASATTIGSHRPGIDVPDRRARRVPTWVLSVAAALLLVVLGGVALTGALGGPAEETRAEVALLNDGLPISVSNVADAVLVETEDGFVLDIALGNGLVAAEGSDLELWVINPDVTDMFSLGVFDGPGRYPLPEGADPAAFPVVDISVEPRDGDATHSGQSVLRGVLEL